MNITITVDDSGNPIFTQQGSVDMDSLIKDILSDGNNLKNVFSDKFKALLDTVKIDNNKISESITNNITELFSFSDDFKSDTKKLFNEKIESLLGDIQIDNNQINKSIVSLFSYKDKDKQIKTIYDKIKDAIPEAIGISSGGDDNLAALSILSNNLSRDIGEQVHEKLSPLFTHLNESLSEKNPYGQTKMDDLEHEGDSVFEDDEVQPVRLMDIEPSLLDKLQELYDDEQPAKFGGDDELQKSGGIMGMIAGILGVKVFLLKSKAIVGAVMASLLAHIIKLPAAILGVATNPITLLLAGVVWGVIDGFKASMRAEEWGTSKVSAGIAGFLAGGDGIMGFVKNLGKWALMGATVGAIGGPVGMLIGGVVGGVIGGIFNVIGAEKIAQSFDSMAQWFNASFGEFVDGLFDVFKNTFDKLKETWDSLRGWFDDSLLPAIEKFRSDLEPIVQRITNFINDKLVPDIKEFVAFISPAFEVIRLAYTEHIFPMNQAVVSFIGDGLVWFFNNLGSGINFLLDGLSVAYDVITGRIDVIAHGMNKIQEIFVWFSDRIEGLLRRLPFVGDSVSRQERRLQSLQEDIEKEQEKREQMLLEREQAQTERQRARLDSRLRAQDATIERLRQREEAMLAEQQPQVDGVSGAARQVSAEDLIVNRQASKLQIQLSGNDQLEAYGDEKVFSREGGTLDKAIKEVVNRLEEQIKNSDEFKSIFTEYMRKSLDYSDKLLHTIPSLVEASKSDAPIPAEQSIPDGYIRDPIYEYRMKIRGMGL